MNSVKTNVTCPNCGSDEIRYIDNSLVCANCGSVVEGDVKLDKEETIYSFEDYIKGSRSAHEDTTTGTRTQLNNLRTAVNSTKSLVNELHLPTFVVRSVADYYKQIMKEDPPRKDTLDTLVPALIYLVCRKSGVPLRLSRLPEVSNAPKNKIIGMYFDTIELLKIHVKPPSISHLVLQLSKEMELGGGTISKSREIVSKLKKKHEVIGKDPVGLAAAAVYVAAKYNGLDVTKYDVKNIASISKATLRCQVDVIRDLL